MATLQEHLSAARERSRSTQALIDQKERAQFADSGTYALIASLRIKLVETERLISILNELDLASGYQRGRADCANNLRQEFGLDRPDNTPVLNLMRRLADRWDGA